MQQNGHGLNRGSASEFSWVYSGSHENLSPDRGSNRAPPEFKSRALTLRHIFRLVSRLLLNKRWGTLHSHKYTHHCLILRRMVSRVQLKCNPTNYLTESAHRESLGVAHSNVKLNTYFLLLRLRKCGIPYVIKLMNSQASVLRVVVLTCPVRINIVRISRML